MRFEKPILCALACALACALLLLPGCSRMVYDSLQAQQRNSCWHETDGSPQRCLDAPDVSHDQYARQR